MAIIGYLAILQFCKSDIKIILPEMLVQFCLKITIMIPVIILCFEEFFGWNLFSRVFIVTHKYTQSVLDQTLVCQHRSICFGIEVSSVVVVEIVCQKYVKCRLLKTVTMSIFPSTTKLAFEFSCWRYATFLQSAQKPPAQHMIVQLQTTDTQCCTHNNPVAFLVRPICDKEVFFHLWQKP